MLVRVRQDSAVNKCVHKQACSLCGISLAGVHEISCKIRLRIFCQILFHWEMWFQYLFSFFWKDIWFSLGLGVEYLTYIRLFNFFIPTEMLCIKLVQNPVKQHFSAACCLTGAALHQIPISSCGLGFQKDPLTLNMPWSVLYRDQRSHMTDDQEPQSGWWAGKGETGYQPPWNNIVWVYLKPMGWSFPSARVTFSNFRSSKTVSSHDLKHWQRMLWNRWGSGMVIMKQMQR